MLESQEGKVEKLDINADAFTLAQRLLQAAKKAKVQKLERAETKFLKSNKMQPAKFYKLVATIDLDHNDNMAFRQGIMLLIDALTHVQKNHPEILVAGEDEEHAEIQLVAEKKEALENIPYEEAGKFLAEAKKRAAA